VLSAGCEPEIPAIERPLTYAVDRTATEIGVTSDQYIISLLYDC